MAQITFRANVAQGSFPFLACEQGQTTIVNQTKIADGSFNSPGLMYCENVMPTERGIQSVGFDESKFLANGINTFSECHRIYRIADNFLYFDKITGGIYQRTGNSWQLTQTIIDAAFTCYPKIANVGGRYFMKFDFQSLNFYEYNKVTRIFDVVTLTGLTPTSITGLVASSGQLIAYGLKTVAWSSLLNPTDFTPSLITGAGGGSVEQVEDSITWAQQIDSGFLLYTSYNVVAANYTGNSRYPFAFKAVAGANVPVFQLSLSKAGVVQGICPPICSEVSGSLHYCWTQSGLQALTVTKASVILAELTNFISGKRLETFDADSNQVILDASMPTADFDFKLALVASRYLVISYGKYVFGMGTVFTYALIYDIELKRWGKIKLTHSDCFEYTESYNNGTGKTNNNARDSIAFAKLNGSVSIINFDIQGAGEGVMIFGKYQLDRGDLCSIQGVDIESPNVQAAYPVYIQSSVDGRNQTTQKQGFIMGTVSKIYRLLFRATGSNHILVIKGAFNITNILLVFNPAGRR